MLAATYSAYGSNMASISQPFSLKANLDQALNQYFMPDPVFTPNHRTLIKSNQALAIVFIVDVSGLCRAPVDIVPIILSDGTRRYHHQLACGCTVTQNQDSSYCFNRPECRKLRWVGSSTIQRPGANLRMLQSRLGGDGVLY
jgi:hypothetical protein